MMDCDEFTSLVTDYLDGRVPQGKRMGMWMHRMMCVRCRGYFRQIKEVVSFVTTYDEAPARPLDERDRQKLIDKFCDHHDTSCSH